MDLLGIAYLPLEHKTMGDTILKKFRKARKLSLAKLAKAADTSPQQIVRLENGERKLTVEWAERLAPALNTTPKNLLFPTFDTVPICATLLNGAVIAQSDMGEAPMPVGGYEGIVALRVEDDSVYGIAGKGWLLYYEQVKRPVQDSILGCLCLVGLPDNTTILRTIFATGTPGLYNLEAPGQPTLHDVAVAWASEIIAMIPPKAADRLMPPITRNVA